MPGTNNKQTELDKLRGNIDEIDVRLLELFSRRAGFAQAIAKEKLKEAGDSPPLFYRPEREVQIIEKMIRMNPGPLSPEAIEHFFREIISSCLSLQYPINVAYLGPAGTFTQQAVFKCFGVFTEARPCSSIDDVFRSVASGVTEYGVVPVENSIEGFVNHTLDNFFASSQKICGEVILRIHHNLLVAKGEKKSDIKRIYAHSQAFAQCRRWLEQYCPGAEHIAVSSNGEAAQYIKNQGEEGIAAIAGDAAAQIYGLHIISSKIEDNPRNATRFLILGNQDIAPGENDKTSIIVVASDEPGSLHQILAPFYRHGINLKKIESRPLRESSWEYAFFIDFDGHREDTKVQQTLEEVKKHVIKMNCLGSYPKVVFS